MELILALCVGFVLGMIVGLSLNKTPSIGKLHVISDEDGESYMFLDLDTSVDTVVSKKHVTFEVTQK